MELKDYLRKNGFTEEEIYFKCAETEILLSILAIYPSNKNLKEDLKDNFSEILGRELNGEDIAFIDKCDFSRQSFGLLESIKKEGFLKKFGYKFGYLKILWFFAFLGKNYATLTTSSIVEACNFIDKYENENRRYQHSNRRTMLDMLCDIYILNNSPTEITALGAIIAKKYLDELVHIFNEVITAIKKSHTKNALIDTIYLLDSKEYSTAKIIESIKETPTEITDTKEEKTQDKAIEEPTNTEEGDNDVSNKVEVTPSDETKELVKHKETESKESVIQTFEESLNVLYDLSQIVADVYKQEGIEELIKTLNSSAYGALLDKVYFTTTSKEPTNKDFFNVATLIKNALLEFGFAFDFYPKEPPGCCIGAPSDDDIEYISKNYRWREDKILYKNLYISAPGILNRKTKKFVYPPLVEVK